MKYAIIVGAFLLGLGLSQPKAKAAGYGLVRVTEVNPGSTVSIGVGEVVGFSCAPGKENMHCYVASAQ